MLLFIKIFEENLLAEFSAQFEPLLRRFSIMEAVAAIKFVNEQPINDPAREKTVLSILERKCIANGFNNEKTAFFQECFKENIIIAKLIQEAFISNYQNASKNDAHEYAVSSIAKITDKEVNRNNLLEIVRLYIDGLTDQIITTLGSESDITNYTTLEQILIHCFRNINQEELCTSINNLKQITMSYNETLQQHPSELLTAYMSDKTEETGHRRANESPFIINSIFHPAIDSTEPALDQSNRIL